MTKSTHCGKGWSIGPESAPLAEMRFTGHTNIFERPSQYGSHRGIDAALDLRGNHNSDPSQISAIRIETPSNDTNQANRYNWTPVKYRTPYP